MNGKKTHKTHMIPLDVTFRPFSVFVIRRGTYGSLPSYVTNLKAVQYITAETGQHCTAGQINTEMYTYVYIKLFILVSVISCDFEVEKHTHVCTKNLTKTPGEGILTYEYPAYHRPHAMECRRFFISTR